MKRALLSVALVSAFALATVAMAQDHPNDSQNSKSMQSASSIRGTVTSVDNSGKSFTVKDDSTGKETTVYWDSSTKLSGDLKVGAMVNVQSSQSSGKTMATSVEVKSAQKPY
jgi:Cu/Ag efflux protein CusF